jgi:DNA adenine methylase
MGCHAESLHPGDVQVIGLSDTLRASSRRLLLSPLRYPGGKGSLYPVLKQLVRANGAANGTYVEPYAGGAGAAVALLVTGEVRQIVINDLDPAIYAFWRAVTQFPEEFSARTRCAKLNVREWRRQRRIYANCDRDSPLDLGFATFYLNRTNHSGILNGGPIGGLEQTGDYKIDARFNKVALLERLRLIALHATKITVLNEDGCEVIERHANAPSTLIYADPPYFEKAGTLYMNAFTRTQHEALASKLNQYASSPWLLTYDNVPQVDQLYADRRRQTFSLSYSAHRVVKATEAMVFGDGLTVPWIGK